MLGLLGLRISEASGSGVENLGEEHGHRVVLVHGKGGKQTLVPLPSAVRVMHREDFLVLVDDRAVVLFCPPCLELAGRWRRSCRRSSVPLILDSWMRLVGD